MKPPRYGKPAVTVEAKRSAAFRAIYAIELHKLTPARIEMLAANVYSRFLQIKLYNRMVRELTATADARKAGEPLA